MTKAEKEDLIALILLAINELKEEAVDGGDEERQELIWSDIEDHLSLLAYGKKG